MHSDSSDYSDAPTDDCPWEDAGLDDEAGIVLDATTGGGERLDRYLARMLPQYSRTRLQQWIAAGAVDCDDHPCAARMRLSGHERIVVRPQPLEAEHAFEAQPMPLAVPYEDDEILVIDKPAGLVVHPAAGNWSGTLLNGLLHRDPRLARLPRAGIVHRLDKDTSGLLVVARTERAQTCLARQLAQRTMTRRYLAVAAGRLPSSGTVEAPIGRDPANRLRMAVVPPERGRPARTDFRCLGHGHLGPRELSLVECRLHTGRTHQIRVHLRSIGAPLVGDVTYSGPAGEGWPARQMLHAWHLRLRHPEDEREMAFDSLPPDDFRACLQAAGLAEAMPRLPPPAWPAGSDAAGPRLAPVAARGR